MSNPDFADAHQVKEGRATILVADISKSTGPMKKANVFYNPVMSLNRDSSIAVLKPLLKDGLKHGSRVLDGMAATGIRGIRIARECGKELDMTINDANPIAYRYIIKNIEINRVTATASNERINTLVSQNSYWHIDIDPYGTPISFLDGAIQSVLNGGILGISATDTAVLCGTYPKTTARRYMANISKNYCYPEVSVRVLLGYLARAAAVHDKGIEPMLSFTTNHYVRLFLRLRGGAARADASLENVGNFSFDMDSYEYRPGEGSNGPIWLGEIHNEELLEKMVAEQYFANARHLSKMIDLWRDEACMPVFYYDIDIISKMLKCSPPSMDRIFAGFRDAGIRISRTHFCHTGFKTDADVKTVKEVIRGLAKE